MATIGDGDLVLEVRRHCLMLVKPSTHNSI
jgi:hypothetical protein